MRLFVAINFNDETRARLIALQDELRSCSVRGRFSLPENLHLTLAFLGECDVKQTTAIKAVMNEINFDPFVINIDRVGRFKRDGGKQRVPAKSVATWWAGIQESKALAKLHSDLTDKLTAADFKLDKRKFNPHITLGREIITSAAPWQIPPFGETVTNIELMKSERINGKLTYTSIVTREP